MNLIELLRGQMLGRTPGINPNAPTPGIPSQVPSAQTDPRWMQGLNSPLGQIGLRMLAGSRDARGNPVGLGNAAGGAVLGYQQDQHDQLQSQLNGRYLEAQIKRMETPDPASKPAQLQILEALKADPGLASAYEKYFRDPQGAPSQAAAIQEYETAKRTGFTGSYLEFLSERAKRGAMPTPSYQPIQGADGQWYSFDSRQGSTSPTGIGAPAKPIGEAAQKQNVGIQNLGLAVEEYVKALPSFKALDLLNPNERARIGTVYNNMMLQAKEAYNLGVLNGPDFEILQKVVTDPLTVKGAITSNEALAKQAEELKRIMEKMRGNVVEAKPRPVLPAEQASGGWGKAEVVQ